MKDQFELLRQDIYNDLDKLSHRDFVKMVLEKQREHWTKMRNPITLTTKKVKNGAVIFLGEHMWVRAETYQRIGDLCLIARKVTITEAENGFVYDTPEGIWVEELRSPSITQIMMKAKEAAKLEVPKEAPIKNETKKWETTEEDLIPIPPEAVVKGPFGYGVLDTKAEKDWYSGKVKTFRGLTRPETVDDKVWQRMCYVACWAFYKADHAKPNDKMEIRVYREGCNKRLATVSFSGAVSATSEVGVEQISVIDWVHFWNQLFQQIKEIITGKVCYVNGNYKVQG